MDLVKQKNYTTNVNGQNGAICKHGKIIGHSNTNNKNLQSEFRNIIGFENVSNSLQEVEIKIT